MKPGNSDPRISDEVFKKRVRELAERYERKQQRQLEYTEEDCIDALRYVYDMTGEYRMRKTTYNEHKDDEMPDPKTIRDVLGGRWIDCLAKAGVGECFSGTEP
jgi:hypothetical protein